MEVAEASLAATPSGAVRLQAEVRYLDGGTETYWFEVAGELAPAFSRRGDPWLALLLPLAVTLREPLSVSQPVDGLLLDGARRVMETWSSWYPVLAPVPVEATREDAALADPGRRCAAFFSGGTDSLYTVLRPRGVEKDEDDEPPQELLTVWGFDIPLAQAEAISRFRARARAFAEAQHLGFADVATNVRTTRWPAAAWGPLAHGCALAAVAHALAGRYRRVLIAATGGFRDPHPWGSHPLTDPRLSTAATTLVHDGAEATRVDKTRLAARSGPALDILRVCWRSGSDRNCGECAKCLRTMIILELLGARERCTTFPAPRRDADRLARIFCAESWDFRELGDIAALARATGRADIAAAADRAMAGSRRLARRLALAGRLRGRRVLRHLAAPVERALLAGWVT